MTASDALKRTRASGAQKGNPMISKLSQRPDRRTLLKAAAAVGITSLVPLPARAFKDDDSHGKLTRGDAAILRFLAAAEILETDLWQQYNELAGIQDDEVPGGSGNPAFTEAV